MYSLVIAAVLSLCFLPVAIALANKVGLVDKPTSRKLHEVATPAVGGVCIYLAFSLAVVLVPASEISYSMLAWLGLVVVVGVVDDYTDLSHRIRLIIHALIVIGIALTESSHVSSIGEVTGASQIRFVGITAIVFTIVGVLGAVNAVNMSDGVDGLLGLLSLVSLSAILLIVGSTGTVLEQIPFNILEIYALIGAILGFLVLNVRYSARAKAKVFLGDAGSTFLGFCLVYALIGFSQQSNFAFSPVLAGWIVGLPLLDGSAVIAGRLINGRSPVAPDRSHLHHLLIDRGWGVNKTVLSLLFLHVSMIAYAATIVSLNIPVADMFLFWMFVGLVIFRMVIGNRMFEARNEAQTKQASESQATLHRTQSFSAMIGDSRVTTARIKEKSQSTKIVDEVEV